MERGLMSGNKLQLKSLDSILDRDNSFGKITIIPSPPRKLSPRHHFYNCLIISCIRMDTSIKISLFRPVIFISYSRFNVVVLYTPYLSSGLIASVEAVPRGHLWVNHQTHRRNEKPVFSHTCRRTLKLAHCETREPLVWNK